MPDTETTLYEGLFLVSPQLTGDVNAAIEHVREILERATAKVTVLRRWDERKLAYTIRGQKRGLYLIAVFEVAGMQIANIERDCNLSENIVRVMMVRGDHMGETEIEMAQSDSDMAQAEARLRGDDDDDRDRDSDDDSDSEDSPRSRGRVAAAD